MVALLALAATVGAQVTLPLVLGDGGALYSAGPRPTIVGRAAPGSTVTLTLEGRTETAVASDDGIFRLAWPVDLAAGTYTLEARSGVTQADGGPPVTAILVVEVDHRLPRRPLVERPAAPGPPVRVPPRTEDYVATTDRWRVALPAYEINRTSRGPLDPYNQNKWKGDLPIRGEDLFLVLTAISDTLADGFEVPTPAGISTDRPGSVGFFGGDEQAIGNQNLFFGADLFKGSTAFRPIDWRVRATVAVNLNHLDVRENAAVAPDVRDGTDRTTGRLALQELFYERKLLDLSSAYDFLSLRVGIQPFNSDFRGFVFTDTNLGVRVFGSADANLYQYNLAYFERLEKGTNSGLNTFELRGQRVAVANLYRQDFLARGYTAQWSLHWLKDDASALLDRNGFLARPDPVGAARPHAIEAFYLGWAGFGHVGRWNLDHALYVVIGDDSLNPIAGRDVFTGEDGVDIGALMAAFEISRDRDWWRPKLGVFYASGDDDPNDRDARGFAAIFENANFAGGGFSYWNRLGVRLAGTAVSLINRGSLVPDLRSSKEEGQPNFVNPGILILTAGADIEVLPELRLAATANLLRFDTTEVLEQLLFQGAVDGPDGIDEAIGIDLSLGARWRPFLNNNVVLTGGVAALLPGDGFGDIFEDRSARFGAFATLTLTY